MRHTPPSRLPDLACPLLQLAGCALHLARANNLSATLRKGLCAAQAMPLGGTHRHMLAALQGMRRASARCRRCQGGTCIPYTCHSLPHLARRPHDKLLLACQSKNSV